MCISSKGKMVRIRAGEIRETGRNTMGVRLVNLGEGHKLIAMAPVLDTDKDDAPEPAQTQTT
jgi:DNA gyrase subunit A